MEKTYKIIPIKHLLKNNRIAKAGEIVKGNAFVNLQDSLDRGFCVEVKSDSKDKKSKKDKKAEKAQKAAEEAANKAAEEAATKAALEAEKASKTEDKTEDKAEEDDAVDLSKLTEKEIVDFAKKNDYKLTASVIKEGKEAMIESIIKQAE